MSRFAPRIDPTVHQALRDFRLPAELGFGRILLPAMVRAGHEDGTWSDPELVPYAPLQLDPAARVLHYAQEIFEGMKAYAGAPPLLFRPTANWERMNRSARRLCMPELPRELFLSAVEVLTAAGAGLIPTDPGASLYLRPFMIGTQASLNLGPSQRHEFYVIGSPSQALQPDAFRLYVERHHSRAAVGGTGDVKTGGNYAGAELAARRATELGCNQTLWLDPVDRRHIEELSGMNLFAVIDGELHTPALTGTILPGITRDSMITLAGDAGLAVHQRPMPIDALCGDIASGRCTEVFACGTAATVVPVATMLLGEQTITLPAPTPVADSLGRELLAIQTGHAADRHGWRHPVPPLQPAAGTPQVGAAGRLTMPAS